MRALESEDPDTATARGVVLSSISMFGERGTRIQTIRPRAVFHGIPGSPSRMRLEKAGSRSGGREVDR